MSRPTTVADIREAFLGFFEAKEHLRLPSDSLIPSNDPTLLFTGAGMNQFKEEFLGRGRNWKRVTTAQKCLRVPDLDNVGLTPRHHTFFEMLGNFSFGDYFKAETIPWEWHFFTEVLGWDANRFVVTVFHEDEEAFAIWHDLIGLPEDRIYRFGEKENFWPASAPSKGPNGPCGPCSEIYYDQEPQLPRPSNEGLEDLPGRFLEVGNFVFTQFERQDGGQLAALPQRNIDVGLGLERVAAVAQGARNNFETDLFAPLLATIGDLAGRAYRGPDAEQEEDILADVRMRRIADHARAVFFCIADGAMPSREGRGYVVRKILRRAIRDGLGLGIEKPFLTELLAPLQETMGEAYPELEEQASTIQALSNAEEERFREVYHRGITRLEEEMEGLREQGSTTLPGTTAFELHDTFGFPLDTAEVILEEHGFSVDHQGFNTAMEAQKHRARAGSDLSGEVFAQSLASLLHESGVKATEFVGAQADETVATILALVDPQQDGASALVQEGKAGQDLLLVLDRSPFYAEGGGQVGDRGTLWNGKELVAEILDTQKEEDLHLHRVRLTAPLSLGQALQAVIDRPRRRATEAHHSATHLLHAAMKKLVGAHVNQAGSKVSAEGLRFDYTHPDSLSVETIAKLENLVLEQVLQAQEVGASESSLEEARAAGVTALFGEKYGEVVRVVRMGEFSAELCGGCHVRNTGQIGPFRIVSDRALAAGVRRLEAVAGHAAAQIAREEQQQLAAAAQSLKCPPQQVVERLQALKANLKQLKDQNKQLAKSGGGDTASLEQILAELQQEGMLAWGKPQGFAADTLRGLADQMKQKRQTDAAAVPPIVLLLGGSGDAGSELPFLFQCDPAAGWRAGDLARQFGKMLGGGGGGRPDFAQGKATVPTEGGSDALLAVISTLARDLASPA